MNSKAQHIPATSSVNALDAVEAIHDAIALLQRRCADLYKRNDRAVQAGNRNEVVALWTRITKCNKKIEAHTFLLERITDPCPTCEGTGVAVGEKDSKPWTGKCPKCGGTGRAKDVKP